MNSLLQHHKSPLDDCRTLALHTAAGYFAELDRVLHALSYHVVDQITEALVQAYKDYRTVYVFGNGGSAALASHFACDLSKGTVNGSTKRFRVMALTDNVPLMTAWANDSKYEDIFAEQLANFATRGDVALAISASGNSPNVIKALKVAKQAGSVTAGLTGFAGGRMLALCDACIVVPCDNMQIIEDLHLCVTHSLFTCIRSRICNGNTGSIALGPRLVKRTTVR